MPKKNDPLTVEEMTDAANTFMPLYRVVADELPSATVEACTKNYGECRQACTQATGRQTSGREVTCIWIEIKLGGNC